MSKSLRMLVLLAGCGLACLSSIGIVYHAKRQAAYRQVETLTELYGDEFKTVVEEIRSSQYSSRTEVRYFKVFEYSKSASKLFIVVHEESVGLGTGDTGGEFVFLQRDPDSGVWDLAAPVHVVWSFYGSADGRTWPPYGPIDPFAPECECECDMK